MIIKKESSLGKLQVYLFTRILLMEEILHRLKGIFTISAGAGFLLSTVTFGSSQQTE